MGRKPKENFRLTPVLEEEVLNLLPGQVILVECKSAVEARELAFELKRFVYTKTVEGTLAFSYDVLRRDTIRGHQVIVRCYERAKVKVLERTEEGVKQLKEGNL